MKEATPKTIYLKDYTPPPYWIDTAELHFDLCEGITRVRAKLNLRRNRDTERVTALRLDGEGLELCSISIDAEPLPASRYEVFDDGLLLHDVADQFQLETVVAIHPEQNTALEGLYQSAGNYCTQCEAEGFRKITYFLDRPDVMAIFTTTIEADAQRYPQLLSNGNDTARGQLENGRHWVRWEDPFKKPSYLFALVAGDFAVNEDAFTTQSGRSVALRIFTEHHNADKTEHAMRSLKRAMAWDEQTFGLEYDLDIYMIVAVDDFNMGAMENKGLNVFNSKFVLARPDTATDADYVNIEAVIAHEYFHNWTGNRVTCRDWFQLSLKEGLTVYRDQEFTADMTSAAVKRIDDVRALRTYQFAEDASPMAHPIRPASYMEINNFYTLTVYEKGAEVVRMYATLLGKAGFRKGMDLYFQRHDGQAVTTDDFRQAMADANGVNLDQFQLWYEQAGTPEVSAEATWDAAEGSWRLDLRQSCPPTPEREHKQPFLIPVVMGLLDAKGNELPLRPCEQAALHEQTLLLTEAHEQVTFTGLGEKPVPSFLRGFSAPVKFSYDYSDAELVFLSRHDGDAFNRWDAVQTLFLRQILGRIECLQHDLPPASFTHALDAVGGLLADREADPALLAEALLLPAEGYIGESMAVIDVDAIHSVREALRREIAERYAAQWQERFAQHQTPGAYQIDPQSMGHRRLKNLALGYLLAEGSEAGRALALNQYQQASNMTDAIAAVQLLANQDCPQREQVLHEFYTRWQDDPLVLDKWFSAQAMSTLPDTLERVQALLAHPKFNIRTPNRVRALIGAFLQGNPLRFHALNGAGYDFAAEQILRLDAINPQVAARLCKVFTRWRRYDSARQTLMRAALERIAAQPGLSADVFEIVSNSLK